MASGSSSSSQLVPHVDRGRLIKNLPRASREPKSVESSSPLHLPGFALLPCELQFDIIQLACLAPASSSSTVSAINLLRSSNHFNHLDIPTTLSLLTVSTTFYDVVVPVLYEHVTLARPSALAAFLQVLSARPDLCKHIKSLYVGDIDHLPAWWNPVFESNCLAQLNQSHSTAAAGGYELYISISLRSAEEVSLLPTWCVPGHPCAITAPRGATLRSTAIREALSVAERCIDVDLKEEYCRYNQSVPSLSITEYCTRLHEVQAVFDLYLLALRRLEGVGPRTYPTLRIKGYAAVPRLDQLDASDLDDPLVITRSDILQHLSRARSVTDRFDSPLLFARSGIECRNLTMRPARHGHGDFKAIFWPSTFDPSLPATATVGSCLNLFRQLLNITPNVAHLSVTSFLDRAVWGAHTDLQLSGLRSLTIEPPHCQWGQLWPVPKSLSAFAHLEEVRVCTMDLPSYYVEPIVAELSALKVLEMCLPEKIGETNIMDVVGSLDRLTEREAKTTQLLSQVPGDDAAEATTDNKEGTSESGDAVSTLRPPPTIVVRPQPSDYQSMLKAVLKEEQAAWGPGVCPPSYLCGLMLGCGRKRLLDIAAKRA